jgi:hypothetical protein
MPKPFEIMDFEGCIEEANAGDDDDYYDETFDYDDSDTKPESGEGSDR